MGTGTATVYTCQINGLPKLNEMNECRERTKESKRKSKSQSQSQEKKKESEERGQRKGENIDFIQVYAKSTSTKYENSIKSARKRFICSIIYDFYEWKRSFTHNFFSFKCKMLKRGVLHYYFVLRFFLSFRCSLFRPLNKKYTCFLIHLSLLCSNCKKVHSKRERKKKKRKYTRLSRKLMKIKLVSACSGSVVTSSKLWTHEFHIFFLFPSFHGVRYTQFV